MNGITGGGSVCCPQARLHSFPERNGIAGVLAQFLQRGAEVGQDGGTVGMTGRGGGRGGPVHAHSLVQQADIPRPLGQPEHGAAEAGQVPGLVRMPGRGGCHGGAEQRERLPEQGKLTAVLVAGVSGAGPVGGGAGVGVTAGAARLLVKAAQRFWQPARIGAEDRDEEQGRDSPVILVGLRPGSLQPEPVEHPEQVSGIEIPVKLGSSGQFRGIRERLFLQNPARILVTGCAVQAFPDRRLRLNTGSHVRLHAPASPARDQAPADVKRQPVTAHRETRRVRRDTPDCPSCHQCGCPTLTRQWLKQLSEPRGREMRGLRENRPNRESCRFLPRTR